LSNIGLTDNADNSAAFDHRNAPDLTLGHDRGYALYRFVGTDRHRIGRNDLAHRRLARIFTLRDGVNHDVAIRDDAAHALLVVTNGERPDVVLR